MTTITQSPIALYVISAALAITALIAMKLYALLQSRCRDVRRLQQMVGIGGNKGKAA